MLLKRFFDIFVSATALIILFPLLIIIALSIKFSSKGPILFCQERVGLNRNLFIIHKFRTMYLRDHDDEDLKITIGKDQRVTPIGRILRKLKLDELPQLFDVFIGNMSIVGPRPEVLNYVKYYPKEISSIVFSVRPGITDWASIKMIDENNILAKSKDPELSYIKQLIPLKLEYAVKYIQNRSMIEDLKIIVATIIKIFTR